MNKKIVLIIFYFGPFPSYFPLFLLSCSKNKNVNWKIYTDNNPKDLGCPVPANVELVPMTFSECRTLFASRFDFTIMLESPKKLCDYKPLYGYILEEQLREYDYWGHCDLDVIYGNLDGDGSVLKGLLSEGYDKLFTLGHLTFYRNDPEVNRIAFSYKEGERLREVLSTDRLIAFDEWGEDNINQIFKQSGRLFYDQPFGSDIWPMKTPFLESRYISERDYYRPDPDSLGILFWKDGKLTWIYSDGREKDVPYVHMQKRRLPISDDLKAQITEAGFYITPEGFFPEAIGSEAALAMGRKQPFPDPQYLKIKKQNLINRLTGRR